MTIAENSDHHLQVSLGLHAAAHDPETYQGLVVPGHKARDNGVIRTFAAGDTVRVTLLDDKSESTVLHADAGTVVLYLGAQCRHSAEGGKSC